MFFTIFYVIIVFVLHLQARDEHQPQFSVSYALQQDKNNNSIQFPSVEQSRAVHIHSKNYAYGSFAYKQSLLHRSGLVTIAQKKYPVTEEDYDVIHKICLDNPDKNKDELWKALLQNSVINEAAILMKDNQQLYCFESDIYINPEHCKQLANAQQRLTLLKESADNAIKDRHKREKYHLDVNYKAALKKAKKKSKAAEHTVLSDYATALAELEARHKQEKKHPLGIKRSQKSITVSPQSNLTVQTSPQQVPKKSNINLEEIHKLREHHNDQFLRISSEQDSSYQQVMDKRSKAFDASIKNQTPTTEKININCQTAAFLELQGVDIAPFQQIKGLTIQHQLTHELVNVLDAVAQYAQQHYHEIYQTHLSKYCAHLASLSQQSNGEGALQQAIDGTNCCHGITHYLEGMVSGVAQAYQQFQTALHYLQPTLEEYALIIEQHALQGVAAVSIFEAMVTAGMIVAPTATTAAMGMMIGTTAYVMAPLCLQALFDLKDFGGACITGDWDKVISDLDTFGKFISSRETVARMAEFAGGAAMPTPNVSSVVDQILSLRPVITSVQNASGEMFQSLYFMTRNQLQKVYTQGIELLQLSEFVNFNLLWKQNCGCHFFDILPKSHSALAGAFSGLESGGLMSSAEQVALTQLFTQAEGSVVSDIVKSGASSIGLQAAQGILPKDFAVTEVGKKMLQAITKPYERVMFENITKDYGKLIANQAPQETIFIFCRCHDLSIVPQKISNDIERLHEMFKNKYLGLQEFSSENSYLTMQMRHIFYPNLQPKFNEDCQFIKEFKLNGFHHDEYSVLEKSGSVQWKNKIHGKAEFEAEECFMADSDWGDGIICQAKTFFPSAWSREKTVQIIFEAAQNKIEDISEPHQKNQKKYLCKGPNNILIEMVINSKNIIISAYPSKKNFRI